MLSQKINLILCITLVLNLSYNSICMELRDTAESLINSPAEYLKKIHATCKAYKKDIKGYDHTNDANLTLQTIKENYIARVQKYEQICPLFLLDECTQRTHNNIKFPCQLSRISNATIRESFEKHSSSLLCNKIKDTPKQCITYTDFGCGEGFQSLIIITKALMIHPKALLNVHLIDLNNAFYTAIMNKFGHSREIKNDDVFFNFGSLPECTKHAFEIHESSSTETDDKSFQQCISLQCLQKELQYKQFIKWLTRTFPESKVVLHCHDTVKTYCEYLQNNNLDHADVITASDIDDQGAIEKNAIEEYCNLCDRTVDAKPESNNALLMRSNNSAKIIILREESASTKPGFSVIEL